MTRFDGEYHDRYGRAHQLPEGITPGWRPSVYALILRNLTGLEVLTVRVAEGFGVYELPGGAVRSTESLADALVRRTLTETGYRIRIPSLKPIGLSEAAFRDQSGNFLHTLLFVYRAELVSPSDPPSAVNADPDDVARIAEVQWQKVNQLDLKFCHPNFRDIFRELVVLGATRGGG